jgi:hypothetical protein
MLKSFISSCQMAIIRVKQQLSLCSFLRDMGSIDTQSIKFHFDRGDFQKWLRTTVGDKELAQIIDKLDKKIPEESLREKLADIVQKRISELSYHIRSS